MSKYFSVLGSVSSIVSILFSGILLLEILHSGPAQAQAGRISPKSKLNVTNIFQKKLNNFDIFSDALPAPEIPDGKVVHITENAARSAEAQTTVARPAKASATTDPIVQAIAREKELRGRMDPNAPESFQQMVVANRGGDKRTAFRHANEFVRYMINLMFEVREYTQLIGEALIAQGVIDEEDWRGVPQYLDLMFADAREQNGTPLKPTHEMAMERIKPDPQGKAEVYFFFSLDSQFVRQMAPDIERIWRIAKQDPNITLYPMIIGYHSKDLIDAFCEYTGLQAPIFDGTKAAKKLRIAFVPSVVVLSPGNEVSYLKTGKQDFKRIYEFIRRVQGLPPTLSPKMARLVNVPIGEVESAKATGKGLLWEDQVRAGKGRLYKISNQAKGEKLTIERF